MSSKAATNHFPTKLHEMLDEAERKKHSHIISWLSDGTSFRIHDPQAMVPLLRKYFRQTKYKSLLRQLQGYDFKRVTSGERKGDVSHPLFLRGHRHLCAQIKRKQTATKNTKPDNSSRTRNNTQSAMKGSKNVPDHTSSSAAPNVLPANRNHRNNIKELESNFRSSMKRALSVTETKNSIAPVRPYRQSKGMDALRVEIGCTFSSTRKSSRTKSTSSSSFKRSAPQQPHLVQSSVSAPELESERLSKRQRSGEGAQQLRHTYHSNNPSQTYKNASFSFSALQGSQQAREDAILTEEKRQFQKGQQEKQNEQQFHQLEKLCFSNFPQGPGAQQFQHTHHSTSAVGTLDLDISLTTTTTTTDRNGSDPQVSSSTICNKFVLPSQLEPTPIISPRGGPTPSQTNVCDGFTLSCDIDFLPQSEGKNDTNMGIVLKLPSETSFQGAGDTSLGQASEISDEIDEGIVDVFGENGNDDKFTFESDCEEEEDDWAKGITYNGKADCVLEPEKFQMEEQRLLPKISQEEVSRLLTQRASQQPVLVQPTQHQAAMYQHRNLNQLSRPMQFAQQQHFVAPKQRQYPQFHSPYALLSKPMPFQQQRMASQLQIQQVKR